MPPTPQRPHIGPPYDLPLLFGQLTDEERYTLVCHTAAVVVRNYGTNKQVGTFLEVGDVAGEAALRIWWNETLNSETVGKGFRVGAEKMILPACSIGWGISYLSFNPNKSVNVRFNTYSLLCPYYFGTKKWQPYLGAGVGYTRYSDKTTIDLGGGNTSKQSRNKDYSSISPFLGLQYAALKKQRVGFFLQVNADFVPVVTIPPIGFLSIAGGVSYHLPH